MKFGAWIHEQGVPLEEQIALAKDNGLETIRSYWLEYSKRAAPILQQHGMSLLAGIPVDGEALAADWRSQLRVEELAANLELGVELEGICVGNELRQGGDDPTTKRFTARLAFGLANLVDAYRSWLDDHGIQVPLTYAMESLVFDETGRFHEFVLPLVDALDWIGVNLYPMGMAEWHGWGAFEESRKFLTDPRTRHDRLAIYELQLRRVLAQLETAGKPLVLTETGFPSAVDYRKEGERFVIPESDNASFAAAMDEFTTILHQADQDYDGRIEAVYFYEWRDNLYHAKIWNVEQSPIHTAFGLCDHTGKPKLNIQELVEGKT